MSASGGASAATGGVTLMFTGPPTPNGPMHVGHLSGPYIASDIAARAARASGRRVVSVCGFDPHQNYVPARAEADGLSPEATITKYSDMIRGAMSAARVEYDLFLEPHLDADYRAGVVRLLDELVERKAVTVEDLTLMTCGGCGRVLHHVRVSGTCPVCGEGAAGGVCETCISFLTAGDLVDAVSTCCRAQPRPISARGPVLRMEAYRDVLTEVWARATMPPRVREVLTGYLDRGLPDVPLAYQTDWGIPWTCDGVDLRIDVWAELALGYLYAPARHLTGSSRQGAAECLDGWVDVDELWYFIGVDNVFYYAAMVPALMAAAGMPTGKLAGMIVNEFYQLEGLKFSTSRNHAIWAHEFLADEDPAAVRAYLAWDRPDRSSTNFMMASYTAFRDEFHRVRAGEPAGVGGGLGEAAEALAAQEVERATRALDLESFDPALAVRCLLSAFPSAPDLAGSPLRFITGE